MELIENHLHAFNKVGEVEISIYNVNRKLESQIEI
jgi:hypothetical protein